MNFEEIVRMVVKEVLERVSGLGKNAVVIFTGEKIGFEESISQIQQLKKEGWTMKAVLSKTAFDVLDYKIINEVFESENIFIDGNMDDKRELCFKEFDVVLIPTITINTLSKVALGISDTLETKIISKAIMKGTKTIVAKDSFDLENKLEYRKIPNSYKNMIKGHLDTIRSYGIELVDSKDLYKCSKKATQSMLLDEENIVSPTVEEKHQTYDIEKNVISREDICLNISKNNIVIPQKAIITALAKDLAQESGIKIIKR